MSLRSWLADHKTAFVHAASVAGMVLGSIFKRAGNPGLVAGITAVTTAFHLGEGIKAGGMAGVQSATDSLKDLAGTLKGIAQGFMVKAEDAAADVADTKL